MVKNLKVKVQSISLEEDAARAVKDELENEPPIGRSYSLDRLGTPLVEVALAPIEGSPEDAEEVAKTLGMLMSTTGRVARGIGTIRQDINISVMSGKVIEVKGVQRLDQFKKVISFEAARQKFFFDLAQEIREKIGEGLEISKFDATKIFMDTSLYCSEENLGVKFRACRLYRSWEIYRSYWKRKRIPFQIRERTRGDSKILRIRGRFSLR